MMFRVHAHANGSHTLVDEENGQAMHSRIGPALEANLVYAERARIEDALQVAESAHVLYDVGMGTAANAIAALARIRDREEARGRLEIFSFETKPDGLRAALGNPAEFSDLLPWADRLRELSERLEVDFRLGEVEVRWRLLVGDFYARLADTPPPDTVFFDFYSPKIVPELWSLDGFTRLREKIGDRSARLFTYSAATPVRLHLLAAGFFVGSGVSTGVKSETTVAATGISLLENPLPSTWLRKLSVSASVSAPEFAETKLRVARHPQMAGDNP